MAAHNIFLTGITCKKTITGNRIFSYSFEPEKGFFEVFMDDFLIHKQLASFGNAFVLLDGNGKSIPRVVRMRCPKNNCQFIMWLLSFRKGQRTEEANKLYLIFKNQDEALQNASTLKAICGTKFCIFFTNEENNRLAAYVNKNIKKSDVLDLLTKYADFHKLCYPKVFVERVLAERFNISAEELKRTNIRFSNI